VLLNESHHHYRNLAMFLQAISFRNDNDTLDNLIPTSQKNKITGGGGGGLDDTSSVFIKFSKFNMHL
jgi:hypothetical protein